MVVLFAKVVDFQHVVDEVDMSILLNSVSVYYDDVNLIAQDGVISSRSNVNHQDIADRIFVAPMDSVVGYEFINGAIHFKFPRICLPRNVQFYSILPKNSFVSIGMHTPVLEEEALQNNLGVLLDVANGHMNNVVNKVNGLSKKFNCIMAGNVHTAEGAKRLLDVGAKYIRVGIGNGTACKTTFVTGYGRGSITEIMEIAEVIKNYDAYLVADGGIDNIGKIVKAFAAGADYVMLGRMFADCSESYNRINGINSFWGMASNRGKKSLGNSDNYIEGKVVDISFENVTTLKNLKEKIVEGVASAISYSGYDCIERFIGNGVFEIKM